MNTNQLNNISEEIKQANLNINDLGEEIQKLKNDKNVLQEYIIKLTKLLQDNNIEYEKIEILN